MLAQRRPSYTGRAELVRLTDAYLRVLGRHGVIDAALRDAALAEPLVFRSDVPRPKPVSFVERKALNATRGHLLSLLGVESPRSAGGPSIPAPRRR